MVILDYPTNDILLETFSSEQQKLIKEHLDLVLEANNQTNLTSIRTISEALILHVEDALSALPEATAAPKGLYGDLGTGAGYPGIPLAIATKRKTLLVESTQKKAAIIAEIIERLSLSSQVEVFPGRIEDLALKAPQSFALLTARALSSLPSLLELAAPLLSLSGHLVCYKAQTSENEVNWAVSLEDKLQMKLASKREFILNDKKTFRQILVFKKTGNPTIQLPRRSGLAQKKPLLP